MNLNWATPENAQRPNNFDSDDYILLNVNVIDMMENTEKDFKLDPFDITGGENAIGNRLAYAKEHFREGYPMDYPEVYYSPYKKKVGFDNGRHRTVAAFQLGHEYIPMFIYKDGIEDFKALVRTKKIENNNIGNFLEKKSLRNFTREEFFDYFKNKLTVSPNNNHSIDELNQIHLQFNESDSKNFYSKYYLKDNDYISDRQFFLNSNTFKSFFKDLNLSENELKELILDYYDTYHYNEEIDAELPNVCIKFDLNQLYDIVCNKEENKLIFRVENEKNEGPYQSISLNKYNSETNPTPENDEQLSLLYNENSLNIPYLKNYKFGFNSLDKLKSWFYNNDDIKKLSDLGCKIGIYEVPKNLTLSSEYQTIYKDKAARLLKSVNINDFFRLDINHPVIKVREPRKKKVKL